MQSIARLSRLGSFEPREIYAYAVRLEGIAESMLCVKGPWRVLQVVCRRARAAGPGRFHKSPNSQDARVIHRS